MSRKDKTIIVRVTDATRQDFYRKAAEHGSPSEVLRFIIDAFIENRVVVLPSGKAWPPT